MRRRRNANQLDLFDRVRPVAPGLELPTPLSRAVGRRGRSRSREAPAPKPWLAVVLAVDTARRSGWALGAGGALLASGELDTLDAATVGIVVANAVELAGNRSEPVVLVLEAPWGGSVAVVSALGAARERWLRAWRECDQALARVVPVVPTRWRAAVLGSDWCTAPRELVRAHELRVACALAGHPVGSDEAPAILISRWAAHAPEVGAAIGKRAAKRSLRSWTERNG